MCHPAACTTNVPCSSLPVSVLQAGNWCALRTLAGAKYTFTIDEGANGQDSRISVNYDGFIDDVSVPAQDGMQCCLQRVLGDIMQLTVSSRHGRPPDCCFIHTYAV